MNGPTISAAEALRHLRKGARSLDVRSPGEFAAGSIPGFVNIPLLNDDHRHEVGLTYKLHGQQVAIDTGLRLVNPIKENLVQAWREVFEAQSRERDASELERLVMCWRGGLRSQTATNWLSEKGCAGTRVKGGYKALRAQLLEIFADLRPRQFVVLSGLTGAGKTEILRDSLPEATLDLELMANHRGSSFGLKMNSAQPSQQTFENRIGFHLFESPDLLLVEAESRMVGRCAIPDKIKAAMDAAPMVLLETTQEDRVQRLFKEYVLEPLTFASRSELHAHLSGALERLAKRLGGLRYKAIKEKLDTACAEESEQNIETHAPWIESLLREYYDPMYEFAFQSYGRRKIAFSGNAADVRDYLAHSLSGRRS